MFAKLTLKHIRILENDELRSFFIKGMQSQYEQFTTSISTFDAGSLIPQLREFIMQTDELCNCKYNLSPAELSRFYGLSFYANSPALLLQVEFFRRQYGAEFSARFSELARMIQGYNEFAESESFRVGFQYPLLRDVYEADNYFQGIRTYLVVLEIIVAKYSKGSTKISSPNLLSALLPLVEKNLKNISTAHFQLLLDRCYTDHQVTAKNGMMQPNHHHINLEQGTLEPDPMSVEEYIAYGREELDPAYQKKAPENSIFSFEEIGNDLDLMEHIYRGFKINEVKAVPELRGLLAELMPFCKDGYAVEIGESLFKDLSDRYKNLDLLLGYQTFNELHNDYAPFRFWDGSYHTTLSLLTRFFYRLINGQLRRKKRFQIHSGFVFERKIGTVLGSAGFKILDFKRIDYKEFDVVTERNGELYNFQCKNNYIDVFRTNQDVTSIGRKNRAMVKSYERALIKEQLREGLLKNKFGINVVHNFVVCRFPLIHEHQSIINANRLQNWIDSL
ncbi:hypothetical protein [Pedobacter cryoconitis]|uniref:hypothetical protein n=1 Tax=Pedobacter cryoconitis TaxID=188932 RepID=UPI00161E1509|nr:hypothetical protein [Pedobacter cryoconitis]MBB5643981.1 hypothetical protein [Pedobacter cryoconitis]